MQEGGDHQGTAQNGLGGTTEGAEGILRGCDVMLKLHRAVPGMREALNSLGFPAPRGFVQQSEGMGAPCSTARARGLRVGSGRVIVLCKNTLGPF